MKKAVAFLLAFLIFVAPMTTFVKADVVIGDNDDIIVNENAAILGRKLALLESLSDLALSGVTEFTISNTNDVDSYLDYLWEEVNDAIDSLSDGSGFNEISNTLKSKYYTNLVQYRDYINNRGDYLSYTFQNPSTNLLQTFFADNIYGKVETKHYDLALPMFRSLSALRSVPDTPTPNPDVNYLSYIRKINENNNTGTDFFWSNLSGATSLSYCIYDTTTSSNIINRAWDSRIMQSFEPLSIYITGSGTQWFFTVSNYTFKNFFLDGSNSYPKGKCMSPNNSLSTVVSLGSSSYNINYKVSSGGPYTSLANCFTNIENAFRNVNIYVNGDIWAMPFNPVISSPTLDIDGLLKLFGNDNPQQYQLQPNTKIDYDQLYQVIYNAIRDNLPISQGDINYYDSHDTIYSPTIINNYGEEEGNESDLIDTILDYAVIPKFDTAIAQPMRNALTKGIVIMNTSITDVIPNEILLILGACFFLLLFAVVINRMIK